MKKIMFFINKLGFGGAERVISNLATDLIEYGYDTVLVTATKLEEEYEIGKSVKRINLDNNENPYEKLKRNYNAIKKLRKVCKEEKPDILISFMVEENMRALLATIGLPIKNVISVRNDPNFEYKSFLGNIIGRYLYLITDGAVFQTEDARAWFSKSIQDKSRVIFNAVNEKFYNVKRVPDKLRVTTCGRLEPQKNHSLLIKAFKKVLIDYPEAKLDIYGVGSLKNELQELIDALDMKDNVFLKGLTKDVPGVFSKSDIFVLSSDFEGMPNVLMEAMAAGVPSISTNCPCGGPKTLFGEELEEWLVPVKDENILAEKIKELMDMDIEKEKIGNKMKNRAEAFNPNRILKDWINYIEYVIRT